MRGTIGNDTLKVKRVYTIQCKIHIKYFFYFELLNQLEIEMSGKGCIFQTKELPYTIKWSILFRFSYSNQIILKNKQDRTKFWCSFQCIYHLERKVLQLVTLKSEKVSLILDRLDQLPLLRKSFCPYIFC